MKAFWVKRKISKLERKLDDHWDDPVYLRELATLYTQLEQRDTALRYYHEAIEAYYHEDSRLGEDNDFILHVCWETLELAPLDRLAHKTLGQEYCGLSEFEEAARLYKAFAEQLIAAGQYDEAIVQYQNAFVLTPDDLRGRQRYFSLLWRMRRKKEAVQELKHIAEIAERTGHLLKAIECYRKALKIMPTDTALQQELERLVQRNKQGGQAQLRLVVNR